MKEKDKESKVKIGRLKAQIEGGRVCEIKSKESKDFISNLKVKLEEGKRIDDCLNTKLNEKIVECLNLEEEIVSLRKELEKEKREN